MDDGEITKEFRIETNDNLDRLDRELGLLERRPKNAALLAGEFRVIHTSDGVTPHAGTILGQVRSGERDLTPELVSSIFESVDVVKGDGRPSIKRW